jgi:hypothetical protein
MTLSDLLSKAADLAPEWCEKRREQYGLIRYDAYYLGGLCIHAEDPDATSALTLFAVLKECERRGRNFGISFDGAKSVYMAHVFPDQPEDEMAGWVAITRTDPNPAVAALSAFVALLQAEAEVGA